MTKMVVEKRAFKNEIIMFTSDHQMMGWAGHWINQMRKRGYEHWLILGDQESTCHTLQRDWSPMVTRFGELPLSCAYSSYPLTHPGWKQWKPVKADSLHKIYILWASRWWVSWQFLQHNTNVLSLDVDAVLLTDIYQVLRASPLMDQDVIISRNQDQSQSLNCGFVYFNRDAAGRQPPTDSELRTAARTKMRSCPTLTGTELSQKQTPEDGKIPAAEWLARAMWERIKLFLELDRKQLRDTPVREVLWEQDAWNDLGKSLETNRRVFPWAVGYGKDSDLWPKLGYKRNVVGGEKHMEKWVKWKRQKVGHSLPPWKPPDEAQATKFFREELDKPLEWLPLCPPANRSSGADVIGAAGDLGYTGVELGMIAGAAPLRRGRMMIAPTWLASLGSDPEPAWAASSPPAMSYLHLTNMWHCFPHMCWSKAGRLFWLRAHGFWDTRLDDLGFTPRGPPFTQHTRALKLPDTFFDSVAALTPPNNGDLPTVTARMRWLAYRRMHVLIHNLVTLSALTNRTPVIPTVPCQFIIATQQRVAPSASSRFGISHPSVVAVGPKDRPVCHLAPGTWRPGGPDQCYHNRILSDFDYDRFMKQPYTAAAAAQPKLAHLPAPKTPIEVSGPYDKSTMDLKPWREFCQKVAAMADEPVIELDDLIPTDGRPSFDHILDSPVGVSEFESEKLRLDSKRPRWKSLLQGAVLHKLRDVCPGTKDFTEQRKACVGYYLAE